jgi:hypothetical protein
MVVTDIAEHCRPLRQVRLRLGKVGVEYCSLRCTPEIKALLQARILRIA